MHPFLIYLLRSVAISGLLYSYYHIALRNRRMHMFNRFYLLFTVVVGVLLPLVHINWNIAAAPQVPGVAHALNIINTGVDEPVQATTTVSSFNWASLLLPAYFAISFVILASVARKIFQLYKLKKHSPTTFQDGIVIVTTTRQQAPFSFLGNLFWNESIDPHSPEGQRIMAHELAHIRQRHTIDRLFIEVVLACCWLNPFLWLIRKELSLVHEFLADEAAITDNDTGAFAAMLLRAHLGNKYPGIIQPFFYSPVKQRLLMLHKSTTKFSRLRMLSAVPLLAATTLLFSFSVKEKPDYVARHRTILIIDAGHGGKDAGSVSHSGIQEKDVALKIAQEMVRLAPDYNIETRLTRSNDAYISLEERKDIARQTKADVFLSLHVNDAPKKDATRKPFSGGYEVFMSGKKTTYGNSSMLLETILPKLTDKQAEFMVKGLTVITDNPMPSMLIECGNIDDLENIAMIEDKNKLEQLCRNLLSGIAQYKDDYEKSLQRR